MDITSESLVGLTQAFNALFQDAFQGVESMYPRVAMTVPSTTSEEKYAWLGVLPKMREWIGDRHVYNLATHDFAIKNLKWEMTISVDRTRVMDNTLGLFNPVIREMGLSAAKHPEELIFGLFSKGLTELCYDKKPFFATDHPVGDGSASNYGGGSGTAWYLIDSSRAVKPFIFQVREGIEFVARDNPDDTNVFMKDQYLYGSRRRDNAGYGLWQLAYASKQSLDSTNYAAARAEMMSYTDDPGRPLGIMPGLLVVPPSLEGAARALLLNERDTAGATNTWRNTAELLVVPYLAGS